jgi:hypothetical protein
MDAVRPDALGVGVGFVNGVGVGVGYAHPTSVAKLVEDSV